MRKLHQHPIKLYDKTEMQSLTSFWETHYNRCHITSTWYHFQSSFILWQRVLDYKEERGPKTASGTNKICSSTVRPTKGMFKYAIDYSVSEGIKWHEKNWRNRLKRVESNRLCTNRRRWIVRRPRKRWKGKKYPCDLKKRALRYKACLVRDDECTVVMIMATGL